MSEALKNLTAPLLDTFGWKSTEGIRKAREALEASRKNSNIDLGAAYRNIPLEVEARTGASGVEEYSRANYPNGICSGREGVGGPR